MSDKMEETVFKAQYRKDIENKVEIWTPMNEIGYSNYELSSFGKVRHIHKGHLMTLTRRPMNSPTIHMQNDKVNGGRGVALVRLLGMIYLEKPSDDHVMMTFKDKNNENHDLYNLKWVTHAQQRDLSNRKKAREKIEVDKVVIIEPTVFNDEYSEEIENGIEVWVTMDEISYTKYKISSYGVIVNRVTGHVVSINTTGDGL